ncbi:DoxX family protein [Nocardia concava]|uniref:DoxX family protein n=1 Tax=Nocardia concava TaxID=257281 RepID=UPI0002D358A7|nr:DoxX family protein [Nocardia concava]
MFITYLAVTAIAIAMNGAMAVTDLARADFVVANAAAVRFPQSLVPLAGILKGAGALGLVAGLAGFRPLGIAAALGLTLYFALALIVHVRERVFYNIAFPAAFFAVAAGALALAVAQ